MYKLIILGLLFFSCQSNKRKEIDLKNGLKAKGMISDDSTFNGIIEFYDVKTGKLFAKTNFINDKREGQRLTYFENGMVNTSEFYTNDRLNGFTSFYNSNGELIEKHNYYYDLPFGGNVYYKKNRINTYVFDNVINKNLLTLNYDSLKNNNIMNLVKSFFFYRLNAENDVDTAINKEQLFLYIVSPPKFEWLYSIVSIDDKYHVIDSLKPFDPQLTCAFYNLPDFDSKGGKIALKLSIYDSTRKERFTFFKKLKNG